jgi:hypothetical protein
MPWFPYFGPGVAEPNLGNDAEAGLGGPGALRSSTPWSPSPAPSRGAVRRGKLEGDARKASRPPPLFHGSRCRSRWRIRTVAHHGARVGVGCRASSSSGLALGAVDRARNGGGTLPTRTCAASPKPATEASTPVTTPATRTSPRPPSSSPRPNRALVAHVGGEGRGRLATSCPEPRLTARGRCSGSPSGPLRNTRPPAGVSQAGFDGAFDSRILSSREGTLRRYGPSEEVPR